MTSFPAVALRSMAMFQPQTSGDSVKMLCALSGTLWDTHYFETHTLIWRRKLNNTVTDIASNGAFTAPVDSSRYTLLLDQLNKFSVITIMRTSVFHTLKGHRVWVAKYISKNIIYTLVKSHVESETLEHIMTTYLKTCQTWKVRKKLIFIPWTRIWFPLHLNAVLEISWFVSIKSKKNPNVYGLSCSSLDLEH